MRCAIFALHFALFRISHFLALFRIFGSFFFFLFAYFVHFSCTHHNFWCINREILTKKVEKVRKCEEKTCVKCDANAKRKCDAKKCNAMQ